MKFEEKHTSRNDLPVSDILKVLNNKNLGNFSSLSILSCENPQAENAPTYGPAENAQAVADFKRYLRDHNYKFRQVEGHFNGKENSFIIKNMSQEETEMLSAKNFQLSYIWGERVDGHLQLGYYESDGADPETHKMNEYVLKDYDVVEDRKVETTGEAKERGKLEKSPHDFYTKIKGHEYRSHFPYFDEPETPADIQGEENVRESLLFSKIYKRCN